jgi:hypothetical protein
VPNQARFKPSFPELTSIDDRLWATLCSGLIATAYRPRHRRKDTFIEDWLTPLSWPTMFVMRFQMTDRPDAKKPQRSVILLTLKFAFDVHSCNIYVDARTNPECSPAVFDLGLPRSTWDVYRHHLDPAQNRTAADLALTMFRETRRVVEAGEAIPFEPTMPNFYLAYARQPAFERSSVLLSEASLASGVPEANISDADLEAYFWEQSFTHEGYTCVPQRYLARQEAEYPTHPVDGSPCPEGVGRPMEWRDRKWYYDANACRWIPAGQRPHHVFAHMGVALGRTFRNPAFTALRACDFFPERLFPDSLYPEGFKYPDFMALPGIDSPEPEEGQVGVGPIYGPGGLHDRLRAACRANGMTRDGLIKLMREMMGKAGEMASDDDLAHALDLPHLPMTMTFATAVRVVRYCAPASDESLTYRMPGIDRLNLYATKPIWASRVEPAARQPARSQEHARASAPLTG